MRTLLLPLFASLALFTGCKVTCDRSVDPECVYRYVMVRDIVNPNRQSDSHTVGSDIYGIQLFQDNLGDAPLTASSIVASEFGPGDNAGATNLDYAIGDGDSLCRTDDPTAIDYVSLGGKGGYVIAAFNNEVIDENDTVRVYECPRREVGDRKYDYYDIYVGVSSDPDDPSWVTCSEWATHRTDCTPDFESYIGTRWSVEVGGE